MQRFESSLDLLIMNRVIFKVINLSLQSQFIGKIVKSPVRLTILNA